ncbi:MAG: metallophosphoesterase [Candidatus Eremiobacteraeota bacterium]|nr:metallophosphoesterase [Candidatus Eremiobacteraeota bacterium]
MKQWSVLPRVLIVLTVLAFFTGCGGNGGSGESVVLSSSGDALKMRFAAFGDLQIGTLQSGNASCTNIPQLRQTIIDCAGSDPVPEITFLNGDMVLNMIKDDGEALKTQLDAWQQLYSGLPDAGRSQLLPIPGNHEVDFEDLALNAQAPNPGAIDQWLLWFVRNGYDFAAGNGPTPAGSNPDSLARDESKLTYSFTRGVTHFTVIDTDVLTTKTDATTGLVLSGWIAINWIEEDVRKAQLDPSVSEIIIVGHRPVETPSYSTDSPGIINTAEYPLADRLSAVMSSNSKVKLLLVSHCHAWDARKLNNGAGVWQVIVGNAGAPIQEGWNPAGGVYFGYSLIDLYQSGKIVLSNYGRALPPSPQKFYEDSPVAPAPATLRETLTI